MMNTQEALYNLLQWYVDMGITVGVSPTPCNHFKIIPPQMPLKKSIGKNFNPPSPAKAPQAPSQPQTKITVSAPPPEPVPQPQTLAMSKPKVDPSSEKIAQGCYTIDDLKSALEQWDDCALKMMATHMVFADGDPQAKIMFVGEAPGSEEDAQGIPFVGKSGQLLNNALATIGLDRTNIYITNIIPWRPPGNRPPTTQEIAQCLPFVRRHIELIHPELLVLMGGTATKALLNNKEGIMKLRGHWVNYTSEELKDPIRTMVTYHPSSLLRTPSQKAFLWQDLLRIQRVLKG